MVGLREHITGCASISLVARAASVHAVAAKRGRVARDIDDAARRQAQPALYHFLPGPARGGSITTRSSSLPLGDRAGSTSSTAPSWIVRFCQLAGVVGQVLARRRRRLDADDLCYFLGQRQREQAHPAVGVQQHIVRARPQRSRVTRSTSASAPVVLTWKKALGRDAVAPPGHLFVIHGWPISG